MITTIQSCTNKEDNVTTLQIIRINPANETQSQDSVKVSHTPTLDLDYILLSRLDTTGIAYDTLELQEPVYANLQVGKNYSSVFIRPGDDLTVTIDQRDKNNVIISYKSMNDGNNIGQLNKYFRQTVRYFNDCNYKFTSKDAESFLTSFDSLTAAIATNYKTFSDTVSLSEKEKALITNFNKLQSQHSQIWYLFMKHNNFLVDQVYAFREGKEIQQYKTPERLKNVLSDLPMDTTLIKSHVYGYFYKPILYFYSMEKFFNPYFDVTRWDKPSPLRPKSDYDTISAQNYPAPIKEFFLANNLRNDLQIFGVTKVIDSVYATFAKEYPNSKYLTTIQKVYDQQVAILPGNIAPNITGKKPDGTVVNLTDFIGRVVYVDVWATWCAPCVEEIPDAINLQHAFKDSKDIIFLNVSVDRDVEAWKNKVAKEQDWKGVHINLSDEETDLLAKNYRVTGYPKYFIIDKNGKIVTAKAPRPSSEDVIKNKLIELLNSKAAM